MSGDVEPVKLGGGPLGGVGPLVPLSQLMKDTSWKLVDEIFSAEELKQSHHHKTYLYKVVDGVHSTVMAAVGTELREINPIALATMGQIRGTCQRVGRTCLEEFFSKCRGYSSCCASVIYITPNSQRRLI